MIPFDIIRSKLSCLNWLLTSDEHSNCRRVIKEKSTHTSSEIFQQFCSIIPTHDYYATEMGLARPHLMEPTYVCSLPYLHCCILDTYVRICRFLILCYVKSIYLYFLCAYVCTYVTTPRNNLWIMDKLWCPKCRLPYRASTFLTSEEWTPLALYI